MQAIKYTTIQTAYSVQIIDCSCSSAVRTNCRG